MGYYEIQPHLHAYQGWIGAVKHHGQDPVLHSGVGDFQEAVSRAAEQGLRLRIPPEVREQMEEAGCAPPRWPDDLAS